MKTLAVLAALALFLCSCEEQESSLDGKTLFDKEGNIYQVEWVVGGTYNIMRLDTNVVRLK